MIDFGMAGCTFNWLIFSIEKVEIELHSYRFRFGMSKSNGSQIKILIEK